MQFINLLEKYSFAILFVFCLGLTTADFGSKSLIMEQNLDVVMGAVSGGSYLKQFIWIVILIFSTMRITNQKVLVKYKKEVIAIIIMAFSFMGIALISSLWSSNYLLTGKRAVFQFIFILATGFSFILAHKHKTLAITFECCFWLITVFILLSVLLGNGFTQSGALTGYANTKNELATSLIVLSCFLLIINKCFFYDVKGMNKKLFILFLLLLITLSKTSIVIMLIIFALSTQSIKLIRGLNLFTLTLLFSVFVFIPSLSYYFSSYWHLGLVLEPESLTGRGTIWENLYFDLEFYKNITLGYGYGNYFNTGEIPLSFDIENSFFQVVSSAHNGYIELMLQLGFVGCLFVFGVNFMLYKICNSKVLAATLMMPLIHNITESSFFRDQNMIWFLFVVQIIASIMLYNRELRGKR